MAYWLCWWGNLGLQFYCGKGANDYWATEMDYLAMSGGSAGGHSFYIWNTGTNGPTHIMEIGP